MRKAVLLISGLDPSGGAGLLADVRVVEDHRPFLFPLAVVSALTVQDASRAYRAEPVSMPLLSAQIAALAADFSIAAVKIGLLLSAADAMQLVEALDRLHRAGVPIVWDPVFAPSLGDTFVRDKLTEIFASLGRVLSLVLPNVSELEQLANQTVADVSALRGAAELVYRQSHVAVLAKGGHLAGTGKIPHALVTRAGSQIIESARVETPPPRGTGCALASEIACQLALHAPLAAAVTTALERTLRRVEQAQPVTQGGPPFLHSLYQCELK